MSPTPEEVRMYLQQYAIDSTPRLGDRRTVRDMATDMIAELLDEVYRLQKWVADLQSGMYLNCVYCGFQLGPEDPLPPSAELLAEHVMQCEKHPMAELTKRHTALLKELGRA